jgi:hypothetical protein
MTSAIPLAHARRLDEEGYVRLEGFIAPDRRRHLVETIDALFAAEGDAAGAEFRQEPGAQRLANLARSSSTACWTKRSAPTSPTSSARASSSAA